MQRKSVRVRLQPMDVDASAWTGDTLLDAALDNGIDLPHLCGGNCTCTTCHVEIVEGLDALTKMEPPEDERLSTTPLRTSRSRLACQSLLMGDGVEARILYDESGDFQT